MSALIGRRVVVTRAAEQASDLEALLRDRGAVPVVVPLIEVVDEPAELERLVATDPRSFDWLVLTSPNGARRYVAAHRSTPRRVAAVGTATGAVLTAAGLVVHFVPAVQSAAGLVAEFPPGSGTALVVQAATAEPVLVDGLRAAGWTVTAIRPYRSVPAQPSAGQRSAALAADAVLFASGSAARAWVRVFGTSTPPIVVAIGPQTAAASAQVGLKVALVAADHSLPGLIDALERHLARTL